MSNSATAPTSTTASSPSSASSPTRVDSFAHPDVHNYPPSSEPIEIIACGALASHIREIAARRHWPVRVTPLPAALHNRPEKIPEKAAEKIKAHSERTRPAPPAPRSRTIVAYADCGTYGALDNLAAEAAASRLPGLHCYDLYAGEEKIAKLFNEEPGTYLLTDYLVRSWTKAVITPLGLDRHPDLWNDYFAHYRRLVWLVQRATPELEEAATGIARQFNLPLTRVPTGTTRLEQALAALIEPPL